MHSGAWAKTSPVAGLRTPNVSSVGAASPAMVMTKSDMALLGCAHAEASPTGCDLAQPSSHLRPALLNRRRRHAGRRQPKSLVDEGVHGGADPRRRARSDGCGGDEAGRLVEEAQEQGGGHVRIPRHRRRPPPRPGRRRSASSGMQATASRARQASIPSTAGASARMRAMVGSAQASM